MRMKEKIKEMNEGASDPDKKKKVVKEDVLTKVEQGYHHQMETILLFTEPMGTSGAFNYLMEELLQRMLDFGLEVEVDSTAALDYVKIHYNNTE
ncbi:hypothetical protein Tco_1137575 [Tanacetum coccineum]